MTALLIALVWLLAPITAWVLFVETGRAVTRHHRRAGAR